MAKDDQGPFTKKVNVQRIPSPRDLVIKAELFGPIADRFRPDDSEDGAPVNNGSTGSSGERDNDSSSGSGDEKP